MGMRPPVVDDRPMHPPTTQTPAAVVDTQFDLRLLIQSLRNTVRVNVAVSFVGGAVALGAANRLGDVLGAGSHGAIRIVGAGLVVYAAALFAVGAARTSELVRWTLTASVADGSWVAASALAIVFVPFSNVGIAVIVSVAGIVAAVGARQLALRRRVRARASELSGVAEDPPVEVVHVERRMPVPSTQAWDVVTDHRLYGMLAPNLSDVRVASGEGQGMIRTCSSSRGKEWSEVCTVWDPGERFEVDVRTDDYPYPLAVMRGAWWVRPVTATSSDVGMDFRYQPRAGVRGAVFAALMQAAFPFVLRRILRGWRSEMTTRSNTDPRR